MASHDRVIGDVARIDAARNRPIDTVADLDAVVEEPLRPVVADLLRKGIRCFETSANLQRGMSAWLCIYADELSDENEEVLFDVQYEGGNLEEGAIVDYKELMEEGGRYFWSIQTDISEDEPVRLVAERIRQITDRLVPQGPSLLPQN